MGRGVWGIGVKGAGGLGRVGGWPFLIDSVNRSAGDVNDWTLPFPRSGASGNAMLSPNMTDSAESAGGVWGDRGHGKTSRAPDSSASAKKETDVSHPADAASKLGLVTVLNP